MTPGDWAASGGVKIERAKEHIRNLEAAEAAFGKTGPYEILADDERDKGWTVLRLKIHHQPPPMLGAIAGDVLHNLRSALDYLWRQMWYPDGGGRSNTKIEFPICPSAESFEARFRRVVQGRKKRAVDLLREIKPYKGGNPALYELHQLDIIDKHHVLIPVGGASVFSRILVSLSGKEPTGFNVPPIYNKIIYPLEDGAEIMRTARTSVGPMQIDSDPEFRFFVTLSEGEVVKGQPIIPTLTGLAGVVDGIAEAFIRAELLA